MLGLPWVITFIFLMFLHNAFRETGKGRQLLKDAPSHPVTDTYT